MGLLRCNGSLFLHFAQKIAVLAFYFAALRRPKGSTLWIRASPLRNGLTWNLFLTTVIYMPQKQKTPQTHKAFKARKNFRKITKRGTYKQKRQSSRAFTQSRYIHEYTGRFFLLFIQTLLSASELASASPNRRRKNIRRSRAIPPVGKQTPPWKKKQNSDRNPYRPDSFKF